MMIETKQSDGRILYKTKQGHYTVPDSPEGRKMIDEILSEKNGPLHPYVDRFPRLPKPKELLVTPYTFELANESVNDETYNIPVYKDVKAPASLSRGLVTITTKTILMTNGHVMVKKEYVKKKYKLDDTRKYTNAVVVKTFKKTITPNVDPIAYEVGRIVRLFAPKKLSVLHDGKRTVFFETKNIDLLRSIPDTVLYLSSDDISVTAYIDKEPIGVAMALRTQNIDVVIGRKR